MVVQMSDQIEKVKNLIDLNRLINKTAGISPAVSLSLSEAYSMLSSAYGIRLEETSPKKLYGKAYTDLSLEEKAEYTQIKRNIQRGSAK